MERRTLIRAGAGALALAVLGGGFWAQRGRRRTARRSDPILGDWPQLGAGISWLLPNLDRADMYVPDRPHAHDEDDNPLQRAAIGRVRHFQVSTGPQRLRGPGFSALPAPEVLRILAIGDSTTFGWGVEDQEAWPPRLQVELSRRGHRVEVLNAGVPSLGIAGVAAYLERMAGALGLHGIVVGLRPSRINLHREYPDTLAALRAALPQVRALVALPPIGRLDPVGNRVWQEESRALAEVLDRRAGVPVLELTAVFRAAQGMRGCGLREDGRRLSLLDLETGAVLVSAEATERDLPAEIYDHLERHPSVREPLIFDAGHMDAEGNQLAARSIADAIEGHGWLSQRAG